VLRAQHPYIVNLMVG